MDSLIIRCECGETVEGSSEQELVAAANRHVAIAHPQLIGATSRERWLEMAVPPPSATLLS